MSERDMEIANTILSQLGGGNRLKAMINIKDCLAVESGLSFKFSGCSKLNYCKITLNFLDTYDIEFGKLKKWDYSKVELIEGIYCDQLMDIFEEKTGLYLTLCPRV